MQAWRALSVIYEFHSLQRNSLSWLYFSISSSSSFFFFIFTHCLAVHFVAPRAFTHCRLLIHFPLLLSLTQYSLLLYVYIFFFPFSTVISAVSHKKRRNFTFTSSFPFHTHIYIHIINVYMYITSGYTSSLIFF